MKSYGSFLRRCWVIREESQDVRTVFKIEHVQTGTQRRVDGFAEAERWIIEQCQRRHPAAHADDTDDAPAGE